MTEHSPETPEPETDPTESAQEFADPARTGVEEVDEVLDAVADLDDLPVGEHVAVFENAHERLRQSLDGETGT